MFGLEYSINEIDLSGLFIGLVIDRIDPKKLERIKVRVIGVHDMENEKPENSVWCSKLATSKSKSGEIPDVGDYVYIMFLGKDPMNPIYLGWVKGLQG